jgi:hypothetical protein
VSMWVIFLYSQMWRKKWYCKKSSCTLVGSRVVFFIHIGGGKNDAAHLWAWKWFFFIYVKKRMILQEMLLHTCKPTSGSFSSYFFSHMWIKIYTLHTCEPTSDFFFDISEEKKSYYTLSSSQMIFNSHGWIKTMLWHIWELANDFFNSCMERKKWYCTHVRHNWFFYSNRWRKKHFVNKNHKKKNLKP